MKNSWETRNLHFRVCIVEQKKCTEEQKKGLGFNIRKDLKLTLDKLGFVMSGGNKLL